MDNRSRRLPSAADVAEINARHLMQTPLRPADLLFVFGTRVDEVLRADTACRLWREGLFRRAIVSGGVTAGSALSEYRYQGQKFYPRIRAECVEQHASDGPA